MLIRDFDDLAIAMASRSISRRDVLKWVGAALLGGMLASTPTVAGAKPKPNKCNNDKQCPAGTTCVNNVCVAPGPAPGPNLQRCFCQDSTQIEVCASVDCSSGPAQDEICIPLCESHGGLSATGCLVDDPSCVS